MLFSVFMLFRPRAAGLVLLFVPAASGAGAQTPPQPPQIPPSLGRPVAIDDAMLLAQGWMLLAQGSAVPAVERARQVLTKSPSSPGAVTLAIEAEIVRSGSGAGLAEYERWLGAREQEEPLLLRRIGQALLREAAAQTGDMPPRVNALAALAANGESTAVASLRETMGEGDLPAASALAEAGDPEAVRNLIGRVNERTLEPTRALNTLSKSGSADAARFAVARLDDPKSEVRLAAIYAVRDLRAKAAAPKLRELLADHRPFIQIASAQALLALGDESGMPVIRQFAASPAAEDRLKAAEATAGKPDAEWMASVRQLTSAAEPEVRLGAARLIAPFDPELAAQTVDGLRQDANPAVKSMTNEAAARSIPWNLTRLRQILHSPSLGERVAAAERLLKVTR